MVLRAVSLIVSLVTVASSYAKTPHVERLDIVEHGIYTTAKENCQRDNQGIERCDRMDFRHASTTWIIPAQHEVEFGLRYRVVGTPKGSKVTLTHDWLLPAPGFQQPGKSPITRIDRTDPVAIGEVAYISYGFDDPWELVPGPWVLEIWDGERKLTSQTFIVVKQ
jgi:hypothetical protein